MMISTRGRYALRMLLDLAIHQEGGYVALKDIAKRQEISKKYLEQIIPVLHRAGLLQTTRGFQGGYRLSRPPEQYTLGEILRTTEGSLAPVSCMQGGVDCPRRFDCATLPVWQGLEKVVSGYLDGITLQDVVERVQTAESGGDYVI
ncbi:MAG: RrF2 family transcriptional regulator [Oscillospiraceae bacterium]|nr:RrF2 family transcriptional regulator [Oscillospiraceae bacterium]